MKRMTTVVCLAGILVSALSLGASAGEVSWTLVFQAGSGGSYGAVLNSGGGKVVASATTAANTNDDPAMKDPKDGTALPPITGAPAMAAWYRPEVAAGQPKQKPIDNWAVLRDYRTPLSADRRIKMWDDLVVWAMDGFQQPNIVLFVAAGSASEAFPEAVGGHPVAGKLVLTGAPSAYWNDPSAQKEWDLPASYAANLQYLAITLPAAGAIANNPIDGAGPLAATQIAGYRFSFVTPEPGSFVALGAGLAGFAGLIRRRR